MNDVIVTKSEREKETDGDQKKDGYKKTDGDKKDGNGKDENYPCKFCSKPLTGNNLQVGFTLY